MNMRTHNSNLKNLLLTVSIVSTVAFLAGCGDSANTSGVKATGTELNEANQAALEAGVAGADADAATRDALAAAAKAAGLKPAPGVTETPEQKAARETAEAEAAEKLRLAEEATRKKAEAAAKAAKEAAEAEARKRLAPAVALAKPVEDFVSFLDAQGWAIDPTLFKKDTIKGAIDGNGMMINNLVILLLNATKKDDGSRMPVASRGKIVDDFIASVKGAGTGPKPVAPPKVDAADPLSDEMLNKPATGADSYGLTDGDDGTLAKAVAKVKDVTAFRSVFGIMGIAEPPKPPMGDPFTQLLNAVLTPDLKSALINAKSDADYTPIIAAAGGNAVFEGAVPAAQRLKFFKIVRAKAIAAALAPDVAAAPLGSGSIKGLADLSGSVSFRDARTSLMGRVDGRGLSVNGVSGQAVDLGMPLFVQLKGDVSGAKATEAATGSVAYRLGNTVIGAIQGYANSGEGFGFEGRQLESSVVASHSFGGVFLEGQVGSVSAANVHNSDWNGVRSQLTIGLDTSFVSPFVQVSHRQLDRDGIYKLNETVGYVGLDMDVANLAADTYSFNTRLLTKVGYGEKSWSNGSKDLGSTSGVRGSVEWTGGMNLNSGISFSTNLGLDTLRGSSAGLKVSLER
jgi:hypothetical protein